jgi:hypothetical protein
MNKKQKAEVNAFYEMYKKEKGEEIPCKKCIFKGKCPSEGKEEVYKICKEIEGGNK